MSIAHPSIRSCESDATNPRRSFRHLAFALALLVPTAYATLAIAQGTGSAPPPGGPSGGGGGAAPAGGVGGAAPAGGVTTSTSTFFPGGVAPVPPGGTLGGGNAQFSSSKPITGNERDSFDFRQGGGGGTTAHGGEGSSFVLGGGDVKGSVTEPNVHPVRRGDTLWDICDHYFRNPYQWPRIWALNPQIQNPHWIFPGDQVHLRSAQLATAEAPTGATGGAGPTFVDRRRQVAPDTIFLRTEGYIDDDTNNWGEISGSPEEKMMLTDFDDVYLRISTSHELKVGQDLTIYRPVRSVGNGKLIEIQGTVKVSQWNSKDHIARAKITEALNVIERGARVGPLTRRFEVVPPIRNEKEITATILTSVQPHGLFGQNQIVFINRGDEAGVKPGNTFFVIRKGDAWHNSQTTGTSAKRIALEDDSPAATESVPSPRDPSKLPEEVLAELRVVNVRKDTAMCIVTASKHEIEAGDTVFARTGF